MIVNNENIDIQVWMNHQLNIVIKYSIYLILALTRKILDLLYSNQFVCF